MSIESFNETKSKLELFREKIAMIKAIEMAKKKKSKGKDYNPHFDDINPEDLTEDDCEIYKKFEDGSMASEDLEKYRKSVFPKLMKPRELRKKTASCMKNLKIRK